MFSLHKSQHESLLERLTLTAKAKVPPSPATLWPLVLCYFLHLIPKGNCVWVAVVISVFLQVEEVTVARTAGSTGPGTGLIYLPAVRGHCWQRVLPMGPKGQQGSSLFFRPRWRAFQPSGGILGSTPAFRVDCGDGDWGRGKISIWKYRFPGTVGLLVVLHFRGCHLLHLPGNVTRGWLPNTWYTSLKAPISFYKAHKEMWWESVPAIQGTGLSHVTLLCPLRSWHWSWGGAGSPVNLSVSPLENGLFLLFLSHILLLVMLYPL